jgi:ribosomal protein S18 acetylase RimI-like enzyme
MIPNSSRSLNLKSVRSINVNDSDSEFLLKLYCCTREAEFSAVGLTADQFEALMEMQFNAQTQSYRNSFPKAEYKIICLDEEKIGRTIVNRSEHELRLVDVSVLTSYRNLGIGTKIIADLINEAREFRLPLILHVSQNNLGAIRLYQRLGFEIVSQDGIYSRMQLIK